MNKIFKNISYEQIEAQLCDYMLDEEKKAKIYTIIIIIVLIFIFKGPLIYWLKFSIAIPSGHEKNPIDVISDPIQIDYFSQQQADKTFIYQSLINKNKMKLIPQAHYILSGCAVAHNHSFLFKSDFFDSAALYDLGVAWGKLSDPKFFKKYLSIYSYKVELTGSRRLNWKWKPDTPLSGGYISSHISHTHIIPANRNIMAAMLKIKKYNNVIVEGELVDMTSIDGKLKYQTSLSRYDTDYSSRGYGSCETLYVTKVRIGNTIYE